MRRMLPGRTIDLIHRGVDLKRAGRPAVFGALVRTAMAAQEQGWGKFEWQDTILEPRCHLGYQARMKDAIHPLPGPEVARTFDRAWEKAWQHRTGHRRLSDVETLCDADQRAQLVAVAIADADVDLTHAQRCVLGYAVERTRVTGFLSVAMPRRAVQAATGLSDFAVRSAFASLQTIGLLHVRKRGHASLSPQHRTANTYAFPELEALATALQGIRVTQHTDNVIPIRRAQ